MIKEYIQEDVSRVMELWLNTNMSAHHFIDTSYWKNNYAQVKEMIPHATVYVYEQDKTIQAFVGLMENTIAGIFVSSTFQSHGIGTEFLEYIKETRSELFLTVYQKNIRAVSFYLREGFVPTGEQIDKNTGEREVSMKWIAEEKGEQTQ